MNGSIQNEVLSLFTAPPDDVIGGLRTVSVRLSEGRLAWVDVLAEHAGQSRNSMLKELIGFGVSTVLAHLPDVIRHEIEEDMAEKAMHLGERI